MKVAIVGDGLLARSVVDALMSRQIAHRLFGHDEIDVTDRAFLSALTGYSVAVNVAAYHRLGECEANPDIARLVNTDGAANVARILPTVYISTDYTFNDGGPHDESLPGETPRSVYGQTKLGGELATLEHGGIVVRVVLRALEGRR